MSIPSGLKVGPHTTLSLLKKRYLSFYILLIWISIYVMQFEFWWYWNFLYYKHFIQFIIFLPLLVILMYITLVLVSLFTAKLLLLIVNIVHKPREGVFFRDRKDKDFKYWVIRNVIKKWPLWLSHKFPFPFFDNICLRMFGVKTKYSNSLFEGWVDAEFIEFGKNVVVGQGSIVQSAVIIGNLFIIRKTIVGDNVRIGVHSVIMPGTKIGKDSILAASSITTVGQELEEGYIYLGAPAKIYKRNVFVEDGIEEQILQQEKTTEDIHKKYEQLYTKRHDKEASSK